MWQDWVMGTAAIMFSVSLIPTIIRDAKRGICSVSAITSGSTAGGLFAVSICSYTLGLKFNAATCAINAALWAVLLGQRIYYRKRGRSWKLKI